MNKAKQIIGYPESSMTQEFMIFGGLDAGSIVLPDRYLSMTRTEKLNFSWIVGFTKDKQLRLKIIDDLEDNCCDLFSIVAEDSLIHGAIGKGTWIGPNNTIMNGATIGDHCIVGAACLIAHYTAVQRNTLVHADVKIAGRSTISENCELNFGSRIGPKVTIPPCTSIGAFSAVHKSLNKPGRYVGFPRAKRIGPVTDYSFLDNIVSDDTIASTNNAAPTSSVVDAVSVIDASLENDTL